MKYNFFLCLLCSVACIIQAQEVVTSSGGNGSTSTAKVTWTIGEPMTETLTGTSATLTQGFNQGDLLLTILKDPAKTGLIFKVYPNPAHDQLNISTGDSEIDNLRYLIIDISGKVLTRRSMTGIETKISLSGLAPSTYLLKIYQNQKEIGIYKIIKK